MTFDEIMACKALKRQELARNVKDLLLDVAEKHNTAPDDMFFSPQEIYDILIKYGVDLIT